MFSRKIVILISVIMLIFANILILSVGSRSDGDPGILRGLTMEVFGTCQSGVTAVVRYVSAVWVNYFDLVSARRENRRLRAERKTLIGQIGKLKETENTNVRLRALLNFKTTVADKTIPAEITGKDPSLWFKTVMIDKGRTDGVHKGMAVVSPDGIVGRVVVSSFNYSKVLLIIDQNSSVDALVRRTRSRGIVNGESNERCRFQYVLRKADVKINDVIITSGLGRLFPKGLRVGYVVDIVKGCSGVFQDVVLQPCVDFTKLEEVFVIAGQERPTVHEMEAK